MRTTLARVFVAGIFSAFAAGMGISAQQPAPPAQQPAQPPAAPDQQPVFRGGISTVRVDVIVTDNKGNPVTDLKLEDFQIEEDGKPQKADTFRLVKIDAQVAPAYTSRTIRSRNEERTAAANENSRIFAFILDDYHVTKDSSMVLKKPVVDFIANQLGPGDLATVMYPLTPLDA